MVVMSCALYQQKSWYQCQVLLLLTLPTNIRFGGDAAAVQAGAAHLIAVDEGDLHSELRSAQGGRVLA